MPNSIKKTKHCDDKKVDMEKQNGIIIRKKLSAEGKTCL